LNVFYFIVVLHNASLGLMSWSHLLEN
jgi:hypothetical protein